MVAVLKEDESCFRVSVSDQLQIFCAFCSTTGTLQGISHWLWDISFEELYSGGEGMGSVLSHFLLTPRNLELGPFLMLS